MQSDRRSAILWGRVELNGQFTLITGRTQAQGRGLHLGRDSEAYQRATRLVEMNSDDMAELGLVDGRLVRISTSAGEVQVPVQAGNLPRGMLFMPMGPAANLLVEVETEGTGMPSFKGLTAEVKAV